MTLAKTEATRVTRVPSWYWASIGILAAAEVFSVAWGPIPAISASGVAMIVGGGVLNEVVSRTRGIRVGRLLGGLNAWIGISWLVSLAGLAVIGRIAASHLGELWPAFALGGSALPVTLLFGFIYDRRRLGRPKVIR